MPPGTSLDALAARWAARPEPGVFAALAEGLAKRGDLAEAARIAAAGLARYPGHAAGLVAQARIAVAQGDVPLAARALAVLLERDPGHPLARELAARHAPELLTVRDVPGGGTATDHSTETAVTPPPDPREETPVEPAGEPVLDVIEMTAEELPAEVEEGAAGSDAAGVLESDEIGISGEDEDAVGDEVEALPIITESLAALYHQQGHLEEALAAYAELAARDPSNDTVAARHEAVRREMATQRPLPFDARQSGGRSVADWLGGLAAARPAAGRDAASLDAFYEPPPAPADATADFDAFQRWLEELAR